MEKVNWLLKTDSIENFNPSKEEVFEILKTIKFFKENEIEGEDLK